jgi:hypothetical protein
VLYSRRFESREGPRTSETRTTEHFGFSGQRGPAQDEVIEAVLRARGEWHPPWKRKRKARDPPRGPPFALELSSSDEDFSQEVPELGDDFNQEVPGGDWGTGD